MTSLSYTSLVSSGPLLCSAVVKRLIPCSCGAKEMSHSRDPRIRGIDSIVTYTPTDIVKLLDSFARLLLWGVFRMSREGVARPHCAQSVPIFASMPRLSRRPVGLFPAPVHLLTLVRQPYLCRMHQALIISVIWDGCQSQCQEKQRHCSAPISPS